MTASVSILDLSKVGGRPSSQGEGDSRAFGCFLIAVGPTLVLICSPSKMRGILYWVRGRPENRGACVCTGDWGVSVQDFMWAPFAKLTKMEPRKGPWKDSCPSTGFPA